MDPQTIIKRACEILAPGQRSARSAIGGLKLGNGQTLYDSLCSLVDQGIPKPEVQQTTLEEVVKAVGFTGHVTFLYNPDDEDVPTYQIELACEATDGKKTIVGDSTLSGAVSQAHEVLLKGEQEQPKEEEETKPKTRRRRTKKTS